MSSSLSAINMQSGSESVQSIAEYVTHFLDLVDNIPNDLSRYISELHFLNIKSLALVNKLDKYEEKYKNSHSGEEKMVVVKRFETLLIALQEVADDKLKISQLISDKVEMKMKELETDYDVVISGNKRDLISPGNTNSDRCYDGLMSVRTNPHGNSNPNTSNYSSTSLSKFSDVFSFATLDASSYSTLNHSSEMNNNNKSLMKVHAIDQHRASTSSHLNLNDKRTLPKRACAAKPGQLVEEDIPLLDPTLPVMTHESSLNQSLTVPTISSPKLAKKQPNYVAPNLRIAMQKYFKGRKHTLNKLPFNSRKDSKKNIAIKNARNAKKKKDAIKTASTNTTTGNVTTHASLSKGKDKDGKSKENGNKVMKVKAKTTTASTAKKSLPIMTSSSSLSSLSSSSSNSSFGEKRTKKKKEKKMKLPKQTKVKSMAKNKQLGVKRAYKTKKSKASTDNNNANNNQAIDNDDEFIGEPVDPDEPVYCLCQRVSFGDMICCDNDSCVLEWFHFRCVDLVHKPKGKWFCPTCRGDKSNVPKKSCLN